MASQSAAQTVSPNGGEQWSGPEYSSAGSYSELLSSLLAQRPFVVLPDQSLSPELFRSAPHGVGHQLHCLCLIRRLSWRQAKQLTHSRTRDKIRPAWMSIGTHRGDVPLETFNYFQERRQCGQIRPHGTRHPKTGQAHMSPCRHEPPAISSSSL